MNGKIVAHLRKLLAGSHMANLDGERLYLVDLELDSCVDDVHMEEERIFSLDYDIESDEKVFEFFGADLHALEDFNSTFEGPGRSVMVLPPEEKGGEPRRIEFLTLVPTLAVDELSVFGVRYFNGSSWVHKSMLARTESEVRAWVDDRCAPENRLFTPNGVVDAASKDTLAVAKAYDVSLPVDLSVRI